MIIPIIYPSAGEFWTQNNPETLLGYSFNQRRLTDLPPAYQFCVNSEIAREAAEILGVSRPLHLAAPHQNYKRRGPNCVVHAYPNGFPPDSFVYFRRRNYDMFMACPELCFLQAAHSRALDFIDLVRFGYDLCAGYYPVPDHKFGQRPRTSFTFAHWIQEYAAVNHAFYGSAKALKALRYVCDCSNSPVETKLAMFSVLPSQLGGCDFRNPKMNKAITLTPEGKDLVGVPQIRGDLVFGKTVVEYNSNAAHLDPARYTDDMNRQTALKLAGYEYIAVTAGHIKNFYIFMDVMNAIAAALKLPPLEETPERRKLFYRLFQ